MRKAKPKKRVILPDPVYGDVKVSKFVNHLMYDGKKSISYEIFYKALEIVKTKMASTTSLHRLRLRAAVSVAPLSRFPRKSAPTVRKVFQ